MRLSYFIWQEWADAVQTDIFEQVTKLRKPIMDKDELHEISRLLDEEDGPGQIRLLHNAI